jgi:uncharacterized protein (TIGR02328 family)
MRLWHHDLIPFLPRSQLLAQWRELNSVFAKEDRHILINYIYDYPKSDLLAYTELIILEMGMRGYKIRSFEKMNAYFFHTEKHPTNAIFEHHHNDEYLEICYFNLKEKFIRGQKDFSVEQFKLLHQFYELKIKKRSL